MIFDMSYSCIYIVDIWKISSKKITFMSKLLNFIQKGTVICEGYYNILVHNFKFTKWNLIRGKILAFWFKVKKGKFNLLNDFSYQSYESGKHLCIKTISDRWKKCFCDQECQCIQMLKLHILKCPLYVVSLNPSHGEVYLIQHNMW
jgi:hypothetical protein